MKRPARIDIVRRLPGDIRQAYLTFDDGPDPDYTPRVLDVLAAAGIRATFFVVGTAAVQYADLVRRMLAEGHEVANHTWTHPHPRLVRSSVARHEVARATQALADIMGRPPRYFRPPFGRLRRPMTETAQQLAQTVVLWSLSGKDWGPFGHAAHIARRLARAQAGDIILLHDARWRYNRPWEMLRVLADFFAEIDRKGFRLGLLGGDSPLAPVALRASASALP